MNMGTESKPIHRSGEDYLEAVLVIRQTRGSVRSVDVAEHLGVSKASVSYAVKLLRENDYLSVGPEGELVLTSAGLEIAEKIYERHLFFREKLIAAGVDPQAANEEACQMEHTISSDSFQKLKNHDDQTKG